MLDDLHAQGIFTRDEFVEALEEHVRDPIRVVLRSVNPLARAIALCDRRIGKRSLGQLVFSDTELQVVKEFYRVRCLAEGMSQKAGAD